MISNLTIFLNEYRYLDRNQFTGNKLKNLMKKLILLMILTSLNIIAQIAPEWEYTFHLNSNNQQNVKTILTDNNNNFVFLARSNEDTNQVNGGIILIGKVSPAGTLLWRRTYSRPGLDSGDVPVSMVQDYQNNIYILDYSHGYNSGPDFGIIKYGPNGNFIWDYFYTSTGGIDSYDQPNALTIDNLGNCFATGLSGYANSGLYVDSIFTIKLNSAGILQWKRSYLTTSTRLSTGECLIADNSSNLYVGGMVNDSGNGFLNAILLKYNASGVLQWSKYYSGSQGMTDCFVDMKFDNSGNIVASGSTDGDYYLDSASALLQKYSSTGTLIWTQVYHTINPGGEIGRKLLMDNNDNIYVLGGSQYFDYFGPSVSFLLKYNSSGSLLWSNRHGDYYLNPAFTYNISFDLNQNLLVTGYEKKYGRTNLLLLKYNSSDGNKLWSYLYNKTGNSYDVSNISSYISENLYIGGNSDNNFLLMKMQPTNSYTTTFRRDHLYKPILDSQYTYDTVYMPTDIPPTAYLKDMYVSIDSLTHTSTGDLEITIVNNNREDTLVYRRGGILDNFIGTKLSDTSSLNICSNGLPPYTGYYAPCRSFSKYFSLPASSPWILKIYDRKAPETGALRSWSLTLTYETTIGITPISNEIPGEYSLFQNYPNPFNPVTRIRYSIPVSSEVKLSIYDINGKTISTPVNEYQNTGTYEISFDASYLASGVYFYKIETDNFIETRKMVLIK